MSRISHTFLIPALAVLFTLTIHAARKGDDAPFWTGHPDAVTFTKIQDERLAKAQQALGRMLAVKGKRTIENTLVPYDETLRYLDAASWQTGLIKEVHPDETLRSAAEKASQKVEAFLTDLSLNRAVYDALSSLDLKGTDEETRYYVEKTLRDFRLAGVDKDEATRNRVKALRDELVLIGQEFARNIRDDKRTVVAESAAELEGLPADFIARHKPDAQGRITLTIDTPDSQPVFSYAKNEALRKRMFMEYNNRAYPKNMAVIDRMLAKRHELANLLGYSNWADYITADKMMGSGKNATAFIDRIVQASSAKSASDYQMILKRKQQDVPGAKGVNAWESTYYSELVRKSEYNFDSQSVRPYLPYDRVKQGVLDIASRMFGVTFRQLKDAPVWHPSVEAYEMLEGGKLIGRFYFDMHPRKGKFNHAAAFPARTGVKGLEIPEVALVCNFPGGEPNDPGLMEHGAVVTFFHEFGHLLHALFAGHHKWVGVGGFRTEWDFVEAPSQMLEEWTRDPAVLQTFAKHYQTNEPIPVALVKQMNRANEFGRGSWVRRQMVYAKLSLAIHDRPPSEVNTDAMIKALTEQYQPFPFVEGTHWQNAFGHLDGYSATVYTYMWSLVIAKDLFSQFDKSNLLAPGVARKYRDSVLAPGGSRPATKLVETFLNRPFSFKAWQEWINEGS